MVELWQLIGWRVKTWELLGVTARNGRLAALFLCGAEWHGTATERRWNGCFRAYLGSCAPYMRMDGGQCNGKRRVQGFQMQGKRYVGATQSCGSWESQAFNGVLNGVLNGTRTNDKKKGKNGALLVFQTTPKNSKKWGWGYCWGYTWGVFFCKHRPL